MRRLILTATTIAILGAGLILSGCGCWGSWHRCHYNVDHSTEKR